MLKLNKVAIILSSVLLCSSIFNSLYVCLCNSKTTLCLMLAIVIKFVASVKTLEAKEVYPKIYIN